MRIVVSVNGAAIVKHSDCTRSIDRADAAGDGDAGRLVQPDGVCRAAGALHGAKAGEPSPCTKVGVKGERGAAGGCVAGETAVERALFAAHNAGGGQHGFGGFCVRQRCMGVGVLEADRAEHVRARARSGEEAAAREKILHGLPDGIPIAVGILQGVDAKTLVAAGEVYAVAAGNERGKIGVAADGIPVLRGERNVDCFESCVRKAVFKAAHRGGILIEVRPQLTFAAAGGADDGDARRIGEAAEDRLRGGDDGAAVAADRGRAAVGEENAAAAADRPAGGGKRLGRDKALSTVGYAHKRFGRCAGNIDIVAARGIYGISVKILLFGKIQ